MRVSSATTPVSVPDRYSILPTRRIAPTGTSTATSSISLPPPSLADFSMDLNHSGLFVSVFCMQMKAWVTDPCTSKMTSSSSNSTQTTRSMSTCGGNKSTTSSNVRHMATWATSVSVSVSVSVSQVSVCNHGNIVIDLNSVPGAERDRTVQLHRQARR